MSNRKYTNNIKIVFLLIFVIGFLVLPFLSLAVSIDTGLDTTGKGAGLVETDVSVFVGNIIKAVLALLGVIVLIFMVYGGYLWMMSGGNDQMVKKSKDILINAVIGLIIVLAAYAITTFVVGGIYSAGMSSGSNELPLCDGTGFCSDMPEGAGCSNSGSDCRTLNGICHASNCVAN